MQNEWLRGPNMFLIRRAPMRENFYKSKQLHIRRFPKNRVEKCFTFVKMLKHIQIMTETFHSHR